MFYPGSCDIKSGKMAASWVQQAVLQARAVYVG